jgi:hypothetical protein
MYAPTLCFQNVLAYFDTVISYTHKKFIKLTPGVSDLKVFFSSLMKWKNKLECLSHLVNLSQPV